MKISTSAAKCLFTTDTAKTASSAFLLYLASSSLICLEKVISIQFSQVTQIHVFPVIGAILSKLQGKKLTSKSYKKSSTI